MQQFAAQKSEVEAQPPRQVHSSKDLASAGDERWQGLGQHVGWRVGVSLK